MKRFQHIDTWVFDMDNTLYDADRGAFAAMRRHMTEYIAQKLGLDLPQAEALRKRLYEQYGTTMQGLITEYDISADDFLNRVHEVIDMDLVPLCAVTRTGLERLPGRRIVHTNAPRAYAQRVLKHLGIDHLFTDLFAIEDAGFISKPDPRPYDDLLLRNGIDPARAAMFEDSAINLQPAAARGMTTIWLHRGADDLSAPDYIHHRAERLPQWIEGLHFD